MNKSMLALVGLVLLVGCGVPFPDPEEPDFIGPLQTDLAEAEATDRAADRGPPLAATKTPEPTETAIPSPTPIPFERFTGVIMGGDFDARRPERNRFGVRSDVFIIYVFDHWPTFPERNRVTLISLPRDLWLTVPCSPLDPELQGQDRVNAAWAYGQFDCVRDTVEANFQLEINAPMAFTDFDGFMWLVGRLGAVTLTPTQTYTDFCGNYHGTDGTSGSYVTWYEGQEYSMGPNETLCYVRARQGHPTGDLDRNRRGLEAIQALGDQYATYLFDTWDPSNVASEIFAFMVDGQRYVDLDVNVIDLVKFASSAGSAAAAPRRIVRFTLEETEFYRTPIYGASVLRPTVDLGQWLACMLQTGPVQIMDGSLVCTQTHRSESERDE